MDKSIYEPIDNIRLAVDDMGRDISQDTKAAIMKELADIEQIYADLKLDYLHLKDKCMANGI